MHEVEPDIQHGLGLWGARLFHFDALDSTNSWAKRNESECRHGDVVFTRDQTAGRGRFERTWCSAPNKSLTASFILSASKLPSLDPGNYSQVAAIAVCDLLTNLGVDAKLKWPNDLLTTRGKICGILAETIAEGKTALGIGLNVGGGIQLPAGVDSTSIQDETSDAHTVDEVTPILIEKVGAAFDSCSATGWKSMQAKWNARDYLADKDLTVEHAAGSFSGRYRGITDDGHLLLEINGETRAFSSGDVTLATG